MNRQKAVEALQHHAKEGWRIHKELMKDAGTDVRRLATKHWRDTKAIHQEFFRELKRAWKVRPSAKA